MLLCDVLLLSLALLKNIIFSNFLVFGAGLGKFTTMNMKLFSEVALLKYFTAKLDLATTISKIL